MCYVMFVRNHVKVKLAFGQEPSSSKCCHQLQLSCHILQSPNLLQFNSTWTTCPLASRPYHKNSTTRYSPKSSPLSPQNSQSERSTKTTSRQHSLLSTEPVTNSSPNRVTAIPTASKSRTSKSMAALQCPNTTRRFGSNLSQSRTA